MEIKSLTGYNTHRLGRVFEGRKQRKYTIGTIQRLNRNKLIDWKRWGAVKENCLCKIGKGYLDGIDPVV